MDSKKQGNGLKTRLSAEPTCGRPSIRGRKEKGMKMATLEHLKKIRDMAINRMNEIIKMAEVKTSETAPEAIVEEKAAEEIEGATAEEVARAVAPEPKATRAVVKRKGGVNRSELIRNYFLSHKDAKNSEVIGYMKKEHNIEVKPSLVSTVKISMKAPRGKPGRKPGKAQARKGLPMVACVAKIVNKAKDGMTRDQVLDGVKKLGYEYSGSKGEEGLRNIVYQALYTLSQRQRHAGWKGSTPVLIHDGRNHTWRLNPKAKTA